MVNINGILSSWLATDKVHLVELMNHTKYQVVSNLQASQTNHNQLWQWVLRLLAALVHIHSAIYYYAGLL